MTIIDPEHYRGLRRRAGRVASAQQANLFFQLGSRRYERGSIILTTNRPFEQWGTTFGGDTIAAAIPGPPAAPHRRTGRSTRAVRARPRRRPANPPGAEIGRRLDRKADTPRFCLGVSLESLGLSALDGGRGRIRTCGLPDVNRALQPLSYAPASPV